DPRQAGPAAGELDHDQRVGVEPEPEPAVLLRDRDAEQPELPHLGHERLRELVGVLVLRGHRNDLLIDPVANGLDDPGGLGDRHAATATAAPAIRPFTSRRSSSPSTASLSAATSASPSASDAFSSNFDRTSPASIGFSGPPRWYGKSASSVRPSF